jgi:hypothetical protein
MWVDKQRLGVSADGIHEPCAHCIVGLKGQAFQRTSDAAEDGSFLRLDDETFLPIEADRGTVTGRGLIDGPWRIASERRKTLNVH